MLVEEVDVEDLEVIQALEQAALQRAPRARPPAHACTRLHTADAPSPVSVPTKRRRLPDVLSETGTSAQAGGTSGEAVENLPPLEFQGALHYLSIPADVEAACRRLLHSGVAAIGFDIEWTVTYQTGVAPRPIALVQLCFADPAAGGRYTCLLLHLVHCGGPPPALRALLSAPVPLKVGAGAHGDELKVLRDFGVEMGGVVDLSGDYANARLCDQPGAATQKWGLAALTARLLRRGLDKGQQLRCSDWERRPLLREQMAYAATDAFASLRVYELLLKMPVVWQPLACPAAASGSSAQPAGTNGGAAPASAMLLLPGLIPACAALGHLQPAKLGVYQAYMAGVSLEAVAAQRHIQHDTALAYVADAIAAGYAYSWQALGVPQGAHERATAVAGRLLGRLVHCEPTPPSSCDGSREPCAGGSGTEAAPGSGVDPRQQMAGPAALGNGGAPVPDAAAGGAGAHAAGAGHGQRVDLLQALLDGGRTLRQLKEEFGEELGWGQLRLALAHLGRCNPGPWQPA